MLIALLKKHADQRGNIMINIEILDNALVDDSFRIQNGISWTIKKCYEESLKRNTPYFDISEILWPKDYARIIESFNRFNITKFTISIPTTSILTMIFELVDRGCEIVDIIQIPGHCEDQLVPAILMKLGGRNEEL